MPVERNAVRDPVPRLPPAPSQYLVRVARSSGALGDAGARLRLRRGTPQPPGRGAGGARQGGGTGRAGAVGVTLTGAARGVERMATARGLPQELGGRLDWRLTALEGSLPKLGGFD